MEKVYDHTLFFVYLSMSIEEHLWRARKSNHDWKGWQRSFQYHTRR